MSILCNSAEFATLSGQTLTPAQSTFVTNIIPVVNSEIETYCDRLFDAQDYYEWYDYSKYILLNQYPANQIKYIGCAKEVATFSSDSYNYEIKCNLTTGVPEYLYVTDGSLTTTTVTFGGAITTLTDIKTSIEAQIPGLTLTINTGYTTLSYKLLRKGTGKKLYGAERIDCYTQIQDWRTLAFMQDAEFFFYSTLDLGTSVTTYIVYNSGYACANMPNALKMIMVNIIRAILDTQTAGITGLYISETITNYEYRLGDGVLQYIHKELDKYKDDLEFFRKKSI
jgi:hypothetical protein